MTFFKPTRKKFLVALVLFIALAFVSMEFASIGYIKDSSIPQDKQPVYFKISPVFWLPSWLIYKGEVSDQTLLLSLVYTIPYWLIISYFFSSLLVALPGKRI